jgi:hypothetical protein
MINSPEEFNHLCLSQTAEDNRRSMQDIAPLEVWLEILEKFPQRRIDVAQNITIQDDVMLAIARDGDKVARALIAEKRRLPPTLFAVLANDQNEVVRRKIAANQKTPDKILEILTMDLIESVANVARYNLNKRCQK